MTKVNVLPQPTAIQLFNFQMDHYYQRIAEARTLKERKVLLGIYLNLKQSSPSFNN